MNIERSQPAIVSDDPLDEGYVEMQSLAMDFLLEPSSAVHDERLVSRVDDVSESVEAHKYEPTCNQEVEGVLH